MSNSQTFVTIAGLLAYAARVTAHGYVNNIVINRVSYPGYDPTTFPYQSNPPIVVGWSTSQTDLGYVEPAAFGAPDIICHRSAKPAGGHARVAAGDSIALTWNTWPDSHHGRLLTNWLHATIPASVTPGNYVLRHEIIALHGANQPNGAQAYPQCFNLEITGSGADTPSVIPGTQLYNSVDPGILYNLYTTPQPSYTVPGPPLVAGASSSVSQSSSRITASTTATVGHTSTTSSQTSPTSSSAAPSTPSTSSTAKRLTSSVQSTSSSAGVSTSSPPATTSKTSTTSSSSTAAMASSSLVPLYGLEG
ncbi:hypothetical protein AB5N19_00411 [Seiridium cardinale]